MIFFHKRKELFESFSESVLLITELPKALFLKFLPFRHVKPLI